jgi:hypothetical protein
VLHFPCPTGRCWRFVNTSTRHTDFFTSPNRAKSRITTHLSSSFTASATCLKMQCRKFAGVFSSAFVPYQHCISTLSPGIGVLWLQAVPVFAEAQPLLSLVVPILGRNAGVCTRRSWQSMLRTLPTNNSLAGRTSQSW